jgi:hypothetical protein
MALIPRINRLIDVLGETYSRNGLLAATNMVAQILCRKAPLLWRYAISAQGAQTARIKIGLRRRTHVLAQPYLAVAVTGGLGDFVVIARFLRDLVASSGAIDFDVFCPAPDRATWIFSSVPGFCRAYHDILFERLLADYDVALRVNQTVVVYLEFVRGPSLRDMPQLVSIIDKIARSRARLEVFIEHHPFMDNFLAQTAVFNGRTRQDFLHHLGGISYGGDLLAVPADHAAAQRMGLKPHGYVTIHNGFDTDFVIAGRRATKCYPHMGAVVVLLKRRLPHLMFVQVGADSTSNRLPECDVDLVGRTTLDEVAGVLARAYLHIDNEGGFVHLSRCYGVRCAVVFGPTPSSYFAYTENLSIDPPMCGNCWWLTQTWMDNCARGYPEPYCMTRQDPEYVADRIMRWLGSRSDLTPCGVDANAA